METRATETKQKIFQSYLLISEADNSNKNLTLLFKKLNVPYSQKSPDLVTISTQSGTISIDEVRNMKKQIHQKPVSGQNKIIIIQDADYLTPQAQNALLKILEEPPQHAILVLVAKSPKNLLPTIISRVVQVNSRIAINAQENSPMHPAAGGDIESVLTQALGEDPKSWIDYELIKNYNSLIKNVDHETERKNLLHVLEQTHLTKKMMDASVNAKFAITNLIVQTSNPK